MSKLIPAWEAGMFPKKYIVKPKLTHKQESVEKVR